MARFALIHVLLGAAVLFSYARGLQVHADQVDALWGTMPLALRRTFQVTMLLAAAGYFPSAYAWLTHRDAVALGGRGALTIDLLYVLVLLPSALWMPLTFHWLETGSTASYVAMRGVLTLTAIGSYALLAAMLTREPRGGVGYWIAVVGQVLFTVQTGLLDPWIWPLYVRPR